MGRGRAKAKQQKVARELKYNTHFTDLEALQRELGVAGAAEEVARRERAADAAEADEGYDPYYDSAEDWTGTER